jgi:hypothetical protein
MEPIRHCSEIPGAATLVRHANPSGADPEREVNCYRGGSVDLGSDVNVGVRFGLTGADATPGSPSGKDSEYYPGDHS